MDAIAIVDFGSQFAHLLANRVRRLGVYAEILLPETRVQKFSKFKGIILSGGPQSVYDKNAPAIDKKIFSLGVPVLGVCYGHQLIAHLLGGTVSPGKTKEYGLAKLNIKKKIGLLKGVSSQTRVWMSHGDTITKLPPGFTLLGSTDDCDAAAMGDPKRNIFSVQYHVEVKHTTAGMKMLDNFLALCNVKREWKIATFLAQKTDEIKKMLGTRKVFLLVSGGVDSTVAYVFLSKILGTDRVYGLSIDTGLLRKNETRQIKEIFKKSGIKNFHLHNAKKEFLHALAGLTDPEEKRRAIGDTFLKVQADITRKLKLSPDEWVLGQGTIYPDTIESAGTKYADKIKTHHNRVPAILDLMKKGKIVEPLAELYKDEVRELGSRLGLPHDVVWKHPFPGPGLAVRMLCVSGPSVPPNVETVEAQIKAYLKPNGLTSKILPIKSVGVQGDARTYRRPLVIWGKQHSFKELEEISTALTNRFSEINRVCLLLCQQKISEVHAVPSTITEKRVQLLQELDDIVMTFVKKHGLMGELWQFPTVLVPLYLNGIKKEAVVLRPMCSDEAMTAHFYKMNRSLLEKLAEKLAPKVSAVFYDITNKPPGTIEWE